MRTTARWWLGTVFDEWHPPEQPVHPVAYLRGQQETCPTTDRVHWQLLACFSHPIRLSQVKRLVVSGHWEPTRSDAAREYVWKESTRVEGTQFERGSEPIRRNNATDWELVRTSAKSGDLDSVPADIFIR